MCARTSIHNRVVKLKLDGRWVESQLKDKSWLLLKSFQNIWLSFFHLKCKRMNCEALLKVGTSLRRTKRKHHKSPHESCALMQASLKNHSESYRGKKNGKPNDSHFLIFIIFYPAELSLALHIYIYTYTYTYTHIYIYIYIQCPPLILAPLVNMSKGGCENKLHCLSFLSFIQKKSQNSNLSLK